MESWPKVLLAENEWLIRLAVADDLSNAGFEVIEADSAEAALSILQDQAGKIQALVTDVRMGGPMNGVELVRQVSRCWPWIALLLTTAEIPERLAARPERCRVVRKPFDPCWIVKQVRELLTVSPSNQRNDFP